MDVIGPGEARCLLAVLFQSINQPVLARASKCLVLLRLISQRGAGRESRREDSKACLRVTGLLKSKFVCGVNIAAKF